MPVAYMLRLNLPIAFLCALLPDFVDKPLWWLGIGAPRYAAHTLLFLAVVVIAFFLWKRAYGLAAFIGIAFHMLLDWVDGGATIPWLYPFTGYSFAERQFDPSSFFPNLYKSLKYNFEPARGGWELVWVAVTLAALFLLLMLYRRLRRQKKHRARP
jgi:hypothetical protein